MDLEQTLKRKRRKALISSLVVGSLFCVLLVLVIRAVALIWGMTVAVVVYYRMMRTNRYVIWLRRFHSRDPKRLRFNMVLNNVSAGLCIPITIQDSSFESSYFASNSRLLLLNPLLYGAAVLISAVVGAALMFAVWSLGGGERMGLAAFLIGTLCTLTAIVYGFKKYLHRKGYISISETSAIAEAHEILSKIREGKGVRQGVMILKCPDQVWRDVVQLAIQEAGAVIIDVSELTDNLVWELSETLRCKRPSAILLTCALTSDGGRQLPLAVSDQLASILGSETLSRLKLFFYPAEQPPIWRAPGIFYRKLGRALLSELCSCIEASEQNEDSHSLTVLKLG